jgi:putative intracellular protease/amidase
MIRRLAGRGAARSRLSTRFRAPRPPFFLDKAAARRRRGYMNRRTFLAASAAFGTTLAAWPARAGAAADGRSEGKGVIVSTSKLVPPAKGTIPVAVPVSEGATVIDFAGPWDVFVSVMMAERGPTMADQMPFALFMVAETLDAVTVEGGMRIVPHYTFENAPACKVAVVPAQRGSDKLQEWLRKVVAAADVTMSVCTGARVLAKAGLLAGKAATIHHDHYDSFAKDYPDIDVKRGVRFVENEKVSTSGGETCGIDLSLRVVERYFGRSVAETTAAFIEHRDKGWIV